MRNGIRKRHNENCARAARSTVERLENRRLFAVGSVSVSVTGENPSNNTIYLDVNNDGMADQGDLILSGFQTGYSVWKVNNVPFGAYTLRQQLPDGYVQTTPAGNAGESVVVNSASVTAPSFANTIGPQEPTLGSISGTLFNEPSGKVFIDLNQDGHLVGGERSVTADASGHFTIVNAPVGTYQIAEVAASAGNFTAICTINPLVTVTAGQAITGMDFYDVPAGTGGSVSGTVTGGADGETVYLDANNNGTLDPGEFTATTSGGQYFFPAIPNGSYTVTQILPMGETQTAPSGGAGVAITVSNGSSSVANFSNITGTVPPGSVSGTVTGGPVGETIYLDANDNGTLDSGELSTVTAGDGSFNFGSVPVGMYTVRQVVPLGYMQTIPTGNSGLAVNVSSGGSLTGENFVDATTVASTGSIGGMVTGGPAGETVYLDGNNNGILDGGEPSTTTGSGGTFSFLSVPPGMYTIRQIVPSGYAQTMPASNAGIAVSVTAGAASTGNNFTDTAVAVTGSITGTVTGGPAVVTVYLDLNHNGALDSGEPKTNTGSGGSFGFTGVAAGMYTLRQVVQSGYAQTVPTNNAGIAVNLSAGSTATGNNFTDTAAAVTGSIAGTVTGGPAGETLFLDANANNVLDPGERTTFTGTGGTFSFTAVPTGTYTLDQILTASYTQTSPANDAGIAITITGGSALTGKNFTDTAVVVNTTVVQFSGTEIGTAGSYLNLGNTIANADDGRLNTFVDAATASGPASGNWVGEDFGAPGEVVTEIHYAARAGFGPRMGGGIFQASNSPSFTTGVSNLYTIPAGTVVSSTSLSVLPIANTTAYRYYRYLSPAGSYGNISELQFYGAVNGATGTITEHLFNDANGDGTQQSAETNLAGFGSFLDLNDNQTFDGTDIRLLSDANGNITFSNVPVGRYYLYQHVPVGYTVTAPATSFPIVVDVTTGGTALVTIGEKFTPPAPIKLTGITLGTPGSFKNLGNTIGNATDGRLATFFDAPTASGTVGGNWVGLDLGATHTIDQIAYAPRAGGFASRMVGGQFQISTTADFSTGVTTLYTITATPVTGTLSTITLTTPAAARYLRYLSPPGSYGNIAELQISGT